MGLKQIIKKWLVTKKGKKKRISWGQVIGALIILGIVGLITSFTPVGAQGYQRLADYLYEKNKESSWAPWALWKAAGLYRFWGDMYKSCMAYDAYLTRYGEGLDPEKMMEAEYLYISCLNDGKQYKTCLEKLEGTTVYTGFLQKYEDKEAHELYTRAVSLHANLKAMPEITRQNHPWY